MSYRIPFGYICKGPLWPRPDIKRSIELIDSALQDLPEDQPDHSEYWNEISSSFSRRFDIPSLIPDMEKSLQYTQKAMDFEPKDHSRRPVLLNNCVSMLGKYGQETKKTEAIELVRMAISEIPSGNMDWSTARCNLGNFLGQRFWRYSIKEDIDEATSLHKEALSKLPIEHYNQIGCLKGLGVWYSERFEIP